MLVACVATFVSCVVFSFIVLHGSYGFFKTMCSRPSKGNGYKGAHDIVGAAKVSWMKDAGFLHKNLSSAPGPRNCNLSRK